MAEANKQNTQKKKAAPKADEQKRDFKGTPEVSRAGGVKPKGSAPASKVTVDRSTPLDQIAMYSVVGNIWLTTIGCAAGAWYVWTPEMFSIANVYWPLFVGASASTFLVFNRFSRE